MLRIDSHRKYLMLLPVWVTRAVSTGLLSYTEVHSNAEPEKGEFMHDSQREAGLSSVISDS